MTGRTTMVLGSCTLLLTAGIAAEAWYLWGSSNPAPTSQRPVVVGDIDAQSAVDVAATDAAAIFTTSYHTYDGHLAQVMGLMTPDMAERYRATAEPVRARMVATRTVTTTRVAARGVVRATPHEVLALLFLDQRTTTDGGLRPTLPAARW